MSASCRWKARTGHSRNCATFFFPACRYRKATCILCPLRQTILKPQPKVQWVALPPDGYMFPRKDGIVLGGTFQHRVWNTDFDTAAEDRILSQHAKFYASMKL